MAKKPKPEMQGKTGMRIIHRKTSELNEAEYNPRQLTAAQFEQIKASINRFGFVDPVIINSHATRKDIIVGGHQRVKVARELGIKTVPAVSVCLELDAERELNIRLNKNTGEWDWDALANGFDVDELVEWGFDPDELTGIDSDNESSINQIATSKPPTMAWCLVGIPLARWSEISDLIHDIKSVNEIFCEVSIADENG